ncbi:phospholipid methyltransferase-domain-containing protein [Schizophyllum commune]
MSAKSASGQSALRHRRPAKEPSDEPAPAAVTKSEDVVWGKTPGGEVFRVPTTHDVLTALFHPAYPKSHLDILNLALLGSQIVLFLCLPRHASQLFFLVYFAFWRTAYDAGLGWVLTKQSKKKWIVREVQRRGWLDEKRRPEVRNWIRQQLAGKMGKDYSFDELPLEYNTWLLFRQLVDVILLNDFVAYCMFAFSCFRVPEGLPVLVHVMRWVAGVALIAFNLWVKTEAHDVVKDYGWYWGDVFFQRGNLVFDGVFELAPHPMYSVGYAGYYGLSLIVGSYAVLFVSLAAHAAQFGFLVFFENPHIERAYGQRKPIAKRAPIQERTKTSPPASSRTSLDPAHLSELSDIELTTPSATEGETATETELDTETEDSEVRAPIGSRGSPVGNRPSYRKHQAHPSTASSASGSERGAPIRKKPLSEHDLLTTYFRRDTIVLKNLDLFRATDLMFALMAGYGLFFAFAPTMSQETALAMHFMHGLAWVIFHCFGIGTVLRAQSESKFLVRHYLKYYHYIAHNATRGATIEAFANFKAIFNMSICMTYISLIGLVWKTYHIPNEWTVGHELLRHTLGALLIGLHGWASRESYEVLGVFGWFFGDFFMDAFPGHLEYTGIYRYLNDPEVIGGASWFGFALISGSKLVLTLAVIRHLGHWWFLLAVEKPHMRKLYGESIRRDAGFVKVLKSVASKNARMLESRAGKHGPEIRRVATEVKGTLDKVYEETADAVQDFLTKSRPQFDRVVEDTKVLLQQSRERLVITRVANDLDSYEANKYQISILPSGIDKSMRFHVGEPVSVKWQAPRKHSRRDWIGIYRVGANKSNLVTKVSSLGMWVPVHDDEWEGDIPLNPDRPITPDRESDSGTVTFKGGALPWTAGKYEVRYHHDGKYNVMSIDGPFEVYLTKPEELTFESVRETLMRVVPLCLDSDPSLIPLSCKKEEERSPEDDRDPDDFNFWSERQAKRICLVIKQIFGVEYVPDVIVADANLSALANRILLSLELIKPTTA